jgi:plastocyanin
MDPLTRRELLAGAALGVAALAGCAGDGDSADTTTTTATDTTATPTATTESTTTATATPTAATETTATATTAEPTTTEETTTTTTTTATTAEPTTTAAADAVVEVGPDASFVFEPSDLDVAVGATVRWEWRSGGHNIVVDSQPDGADWSGTAGEDTYDEGHTHTHTFDTAGTYEYYCDPHRALDMVGTVTVG